MEIWITGAQFTDAERETADAAAAAVFSAAGIKAEDAYIAALQLALSTDSEVVDLGAARLWREAEAAAVAAVTADWILPPDSIFIELA